MRYVKILLHLGMRVKRVTVLTSILGKAQTTLWGSRRLSMFEDILHLWVLYSCHEITDAGHRDVLMERH
jgi:hypothetical protein